MTRRNLLLPEDGIVDEIAIEIACSGERQVSLTPGERAIALARLNRRGHCVETIQQRLGMGTQSVRKGLRFLTESDSMV